LIIGEERLIGSRAPIFDDPSDSPLPSFAPLVAFLDLRSEPRSASILIPKSFCSSLFWIYRILILNLIRNKIHLIGRATSATLVNDHIHQWDTRVTCQVGNPLDLPVNWNWSLYSECCASLPPCSVPARLRPQASSSPGSRFWHKFENFHEVAQD